MSVAMNLEWSFGDRLAKARRFADLEQAEMALRLGVSRALISKWERDVTEPTASQALRWAEACGVDAAWLLGLAPTTTCLAMPSLSLVENPPNDAMQLFDPDGFGLEVPYVTIVTTGA